MLIVRKNTDLGVWFDIKYRGANMRLKLRPFSHEVDKKLNKKLTKHHAIVNADTKQVERVPQLDYEAKVAEMADYLIEDFEDVQDETGKPLEVTPENKLFLVLLAPDDSDEKPLWQIVLAKANALMTIDEKDFKAQEKN